MEEEKKGAEQKDAVVELFEEGKTEKEVIGVLGQSKKNSVYNWFKQWQEVKEAESLD